MKKKRTKVLAAILSVMLIMVAGLLVACGRGIPSPPGFVTNPPATQEAAYNIARGQNWDELWLDDFIWIWCEETGDEIMLDGQALFGVRYHYPSGAPSRPNTGPMPRERDFTDEHGDIDRDAYDDAWDVWEATYGALLEEWDDAFEAWFEANPNVTLGVEVFMMFWAENVEDAILVYLAMSEPREEAEITEFTYSLTRRGNIVSLWYFYRFSIDEEGRARGQL